MSSTFCLNIQVAGDVFPILKIGSMHIKMKIITGRIIVFLILLLSAGAMPVQAQESKQAPPVDEDCMADEADYDCQPTSLDEEDFDKMASTVFMQRDLPALVELEPLDSDDALIKRYMLNARGIMAREVPIPNSEDHFCTLSSATNLSLKYFPASGLWVFVVDFSPEAELLAGGLATCLDARQAVKQFSETDDED
jgi:hypothetical protein